MPSPFNPMTLLGVALISCVLVMYRLYSILHSPNHWKTKPQSCLSSTRSLAVFLGSGGHTSEALALVSSLDFDKYTPRTYILSEGDTLSAKKAAALEMLKKPGNSEYTILTMPRARRVHQSLATTPLTAARSLLWTFQMMTFSKKSLADVLVINGPGTCVVLALVAYFNRFFGLDSPRIIYIESFARVSRLSLSGKLVRPLADRFLVQWPGLVQTTGLGKPEHRGWLV